MEITIKQDALTLLLILLWSSGLTDGNDVNQTSTLWTKQGEDATIDCSHNKGAGYYQMYWYRQLPGETMKLIVFTTGNNNHDFGDFSKDKFSATKPEAERGTFTVKNVQPEDQGLYFCAVSQGGGYDPAYFGKGTKLTVLETGLEVTKPKSVKILPPSPKECRNEKDKFRKKTLVCVASGFYPDHVEVLWTINGNEAKDGVATDSAAKRVDKFYRITSRLRVLADDYNKPSNNFTCIVKFFDGEKTTLHHTSINGIEGEAAGGLKREDFLKMTNTAKLSYIVLIAKSCFYGLFVVFLVWKLQGSARKFH